MAERVALLGTGLIGGSIGLRLRGPGSSTEVVGFDTDGAALDVALRRDAVSATAASPERAVAGADLVILAAPVDEARVLCEAIGAAVSDDCVVTDVGSAKAPIVATGERAFGVRFVGGHPMAGSERHGIEAADEGLFEGAWWILTPTPRTSPEAYGRVADLVAGLGATPVAVDPLEHDALVARLSHLPQLVASALVEVAVGAGDREAMLGLAASGFRDVTRIAASHPDLWVGIIRANRGPVLDALVGLEGRLAGITKIIEDSDWAALTSFFARARSARMDLFAKPDIGGVPVTLSMLVPDRPGVLAEVTTAAGQLGANIEDLRIVHSTEGGRGRLELIVGGETAAGSLAAELTALGYHVDRGE